LKSKLFYQFLQKDIPKLAQTPSTDLEIPWLFVVHGIRTKDIEYFIGRLDLLTLIAPVALDAGACQLEANELQQERGGMSQAWLSEMVQLACPCGYVLTEQEFCQWPKDENLLDSYTYLDSKYMPVDRFTMDAMQIAAVAAICGGTYVGGKCCFQFKTCLSYNLPSYEDDDEAIIYDEFNPCPVGWESNGATCQRCGIGKYRDALTLQYSIGTVTFFDRLQCLDCVPCAKTQFRRATCGPHKQNACRSCQTPTSCATGLQLIPDAIRVTNDLGSTLSAQLIGNTLATSNAWYTCMYTPPASGGRRVENSYNYHSCKSETIFFDFCALNYETQTPPLEDNLCLRMNDFFDGKYDFDYLRAVFYVDEKPCNEGSFAIWQASSPSNGKFKCENCLQYVTERLHATDFIRDFSFLKHYVGSCTPYHLRDEPCGLQTPGDWRLAVDDRAAVGFYTDVTECTTRVDYGLLGAGPIDPCNSKAIHIEGQFLAQCNDFYAKQEGRLTKPGLLYRDCSTQFDRCSQDTVLAYCGLHYSQETYWGVDNSWKTFDRLASPPATSYDMGGVMHKGTCISCEAIAQAKCTVDQTYLYKCGQRDADNQVIDKLLDLTFSDDSIVAGSCELCGFADIEVCYANYNYSENLDFWHDECDGQTVIEPGSLACQLCSDEFLSQECNEREYLKNCGGTEGGDCTNCTADDIVRSDAEKLVFYTNSLDARYPRCVFTCLQAYTGFFCTIPWVVLVCPSDKYASAKTPPYVQQCKQCQNVVPDASILNNQSNLLDNLLSYADFDYFFPDSLSSSGFSDKSSNLLTDILSITSGGMDGSFTYVGHSMIDPNYALYTNTSLQIVPCSPDGAYQPYESRHPLHTYACGIAYVRFTGNQPVAFEMVLGEMVQARHFVFSVLVRHFDSTSLQCTITIEIFDTESNTLLLDYDGEPYTATRHNFTLDSDTWHNVRMFIFKAYPYTSQAGMCKLRVYLHTTMAADIAVDDIIFSNTKTMIRAEGSITSGKRFGGDYKVGYRDAASGNIVEMWGKSNYWVNVADFSVVQTTDADGDMVSDLIGLKAYLVRRDTSLYLTSNVYMPLHYRQANVFTAAWLTVDFDVYNLNASALTITLSTFCINRYNRGLQFAHGVRQITSPQAVWSHLSVSFTGEIFNFCDSSDKRWDDELDIHVQGGDALVDNIIVWEKPHTCAWQCDRFTYRKHETCINCIHRLSCGIGTYEYACSVTGYSQYDESYCKYSQYTEFRTRLGADMCSNSDPTGDLTSEFVTADAEFGNAVCRSCTNKPDNAEYISVASCEFVCIDGFFLNSSSIPVSCTRCLEPTCAVGYTLEACADNFQTQCVSCNVIETIESDELALARYVYTTPGSCDYACVSGYFLQDKRCRPCTIDILCDSGTQRIQLCSTDSNTRCIDCEAPPPTQVLVAGSSIAGEPCTYACKPGYYACIDCNDVTPTSSILFQNLHGALRDGFPSGVQWDLVQGKLSLPVYNFFTFEDTWVKLVGEPFVQPRLLAALRVLLPARFYGHVIAKFFGQSKGSPVTIDIRGYDKDRERWTYWGKQTILNTVASEYTLSKDWITATQYNEIMFFFEGFASTLLLQGRETARNIILWNDVQVEVVNYATDSGAPCCLDSTTCYQCDNSSVPVGASIFAQEGSQQNASCAWVCNEDYIRIGASCLYCPRTLCETGFYQSGCPNCTACELPATLNVPAEVVEFTSSGLRLLEPTSCNFACKSGYFEGRDPFNCTVCTALSQLQCNARQYIRNCSRYTDSQCIACTEACGIGFFLSQPCTNYTDSVCSPCTNNKPIGSQWVINRTCEWECVSSGAFAIDLTDSPTYVYNNETQQCQTCQPQCAIGYYKTVCTVSNQFTGCEPCAAPNGSVMISSGILLNNSCIWQCPTATSLQYSDKSSQCVPDVLPTPVTPCSITCPTGRQPNSRQCTCDPCPAKPNGTLSMWLDASTSSKPCQWGCVFPYLPNLAHTQCVSLLSLFTGIDSGGIGSNTSRFVTARQVDNSVNAELVAGGPGLGIAMIIICILVCKRIRRRKKMSTSATKIPSHVVKDIH
jgi:hypothetical protein